jgi:hypothetical protein
VLTRFHQATVEYGLPGRRDRNENVCPLHDLFGRFRRVNRAAQEPFHVCAEMPASLGIPPEGAHFLDAAHLAYGLELRLGLPSRAEDSHNFGLRTGQVFGGDAAGGARPDLP